MSRWQPLDHGREEWYPPGLGSAELVLSGGGSPRPALRLPISTFAVHYGGAGTSWLDEGDTAAELRSVELNHARPSGKPNEYNSASDSSSETWEYAGRFRAAHAHGWNDRAWGHLVLLGLEVIDDAMASRLIAGVRRARQQLVDAGWLTADHRVASHAELAVTTTRTQCPGPLWANKQWWSQIAAPLTSPIPPAEDSMQLIDPSRSRLTDTRTGTAFDGSVGLRQPNTLWLPAKHPDVPEGARAMWVRITSVTDGNTPGGFVTCWPGGDTPNTSQHNWPAGTARGLGSLACVPLSPSGRMVVTVSAPCHIVLDVVGWER
jgi:hypothetical protein